MLVTYVNSCFIIIRQNSSPFLFVAESVKILVWPSWSLLDYSPLMIISCEVCCCRINICRGGHTRILTDSATKRNGEEFWRIIIKQELT
jgi:hypothetical protein